MIKSPGDKDWNPAVERQISLSMTTQRSDAGATMCGYMPTSFTSRQILLDVDIAIRRPYTTYFGHISPHATGSRYSWCVFSSTSGRPEALRLYRIVFCPRIFLASSVSFVRATCLPPDMARAAPVPRHCWGETILCANYHIKP